MFNKIEELLKSHNMTLNKLSKAVGIPYMTLKSWKLRGSSPRLENVKKIADYFEVPVEYFFEDDSENLDQSINIKITDSTLNNSEVTGIKSITSSAKDEYIKKVSELMEEMTTEGKERMVDQAEFLKSKYKK